MTMWNLSVLLLLTTLTIAAPAHAFFANPEALNGLTRKHDGSGCAACHLAAVQEYTSTISGPTRLRSGQSAIYSLTAAKTGVADNVNMGHTIAASDFPSPLSAVLALSTITGTGELIHNGDLGVFAKTSGGSATTPFRYTMPADAAVGSTHTIYAVSCLGWYDSWQHAANFVVTTSAGSVSTDLNGDGKSDMLWRNAQTGDVFRMIMNGFSVSAAGSVYSEPNTAWRVVADGDFNGDGTTDLLWRNSETGQVYVMPFSTMATPQPGGIVAVEPNSAWRIVQATDIDGDGKSDIVWWNSATGQVYAMLMNGASIAAQGFVYTEPDTQWNIVASGDFTGTGKANQLLWRHSGNGSVYRMTVMFSGGVFSQTGATVYQEPNASWRIVAAADFNGDGKSDILWRNASTGAVYMMVTGAAAATVWVEPNLAWNIMAVGDYGGDGKADILWRNADTGQVYMMAMNGTSISSAAMVYQEPSEAWRLLGPTEYAAQ
jgi:hypothetical protein